MQLRTINCVISPPPNVFIYHMYAWRWNTFNHLLPERRATVRLSNPWERAWVYFGEYWVILDHFKIRTLVSNLAFRTSYERGLIGFIKINPHFLLDKQYIRLKIGCILVNFVTRRDVTWRYVTNAFFLVVWLVENSILWISDKGRTRLTWAFGQWQSLSNRQL